jgi:Ca-activated chloride channel homolog
VGIPLGGGGGGGGPVPRGTLAASVNTAAAVSASRAATGSSIGLATGGAQDIENFRQNVAEGYLPLPTDVTFGGIVKRYFFNMRPPKTAPPKLRRLAKTSSVPPYSTARAPEPLVVSAFQGPSGPRPGRQDVFLAVGLDSGLRPEDAARRRLNLAVVLDVSGSMGAPFDRYYSMTG